MIRFNSVLQPERVGYQLSSGCDGGDLWGIYYRTPPRQFISLNLQQYDTLGDSGVQHTPAYPARRENLGDCMVSLLKFCEDYILAEGLQSDTVRNALSALYLPTPRPSCIELLMGLRYNENKQQWWSWDECKVSSGKRARYDKRYYEVRKEYDGLKPIEQVAMGYFESHSSTMGLLDQAYIRYQAQHLKEPWFMGNPWYDELKREEWDAIHIFFEFMTGMEHVYSALSWRRSVICQWNSDHKQEAVA